MPTEPQASMTTQVFEIYIKATPQSHLGSDHEPRMECEVRLPGTDALRAAPRRQVSLRRANADMRRIGLPEVIIDGEVLESVPPRRLVHTYRWLFTEENKREGFTKVTCEIEQTPAGFSRLTVIHDLEGAPTMAEAVKSRFNLQGGGGWNWILSDLKSLIETGKIMSAA